MRLSLRAIGMGVGVAAAMISTAAYGQATSLNLTAKLNPVAASSNSAKPTSVTGPSPAQAFADRQAVQREIPWYERFTNSAAPNNAYGDALASEEGASLTVAPSPRWGVSLDTRQQAPSALRPVRDEAAVSAYFQFTPRLRVGGRLSLAERANPGTTPRESTSSVRIESAFKF